MGEAREFGVVIMTYNEIQRLMIAAGEAGDAKMIATCRRALAGSARALAICKRVVRESEAKS